MRVLQLGKYYPPHRGGMETHLADLCRELKDRVKLEVLVSQSGSARSGKAITETVDGVEVTRMSTPWEILANPVNPDLAGRIARSEADIVHLHWPNPLALLAYMASGSKAKLVITYHSDIVRQRMTGALLRPLLNRALRRATILATSPNYMDSSSVLQAFRSQCRIVPLGIDPTRYAQADAGKVRAYKERFGGQMVLATGRHIYYKGFQYLIDAMRTAPGHLVIAGDGPMRSELEARARAAGLSDRVTFLGQVSDEDLRALYVAAKVFALPSVARSEAFGLVQLEAMVAGTPVVNTAIDSGVPYVSLHEETGLTVPPADAPSLARALERILRDPWLQSRYGAAARERVHRHFTVERMAAATYGIYREVLGLPIEQKMAAHANA